MSAASLPLRRRAAASLPSLLAVAAVAAVAYALAWTTANTSFEVWGGVVSGTVLFALTLPLVVVVARREEDERIRRLLYLLLALKFAAAIARYAVAFDLYDGVADAGRYHQWGEMVARDFRDGIFFDTPIPRNFVGTGFVGYLTGAVYTVTGATNLGGFFAFALMGYWGLYFFYRAFRTACPEGDPFRYAALMFLLPSLVFWPSSVGKEAWMTLGLGLLALGAARLLAGQRGAFVLLLLGIGATSLIRPHVAAIATMGLVVALAFRRQPQAASVLAPVAKLLGIIVLVAAVAFVAGQSKDVLGLDEFNTDALILVRESVRQQTTVGESTFEGSDTDFEPGELPAATLSVLFRPYPWEARNAQSLIASIEGAVLFGAFVVSWRRVVGAVRSMVRNPYIVFCLVYALLFIYGFSAFANFGILVRQRVQVLPFVLVLLALPVWRREDEGWRGLVGAAPRPRARAPLEGVGA